MNDPILPNLEHLLVRAARQRSTPRLQRRRWVMAAAAISVVLAGCAAAAVTQVFLATGEVDGGTFTVEVVRVSEPDGDDAEGSVCLKLTFSGRGSAYGCGSEPSGARPFGLVIADPLDGGERRVVYGLVVEKIARVRVISPHGTAEAATESNEELQGRFFSIVAPAGGALQLIGLANDGKLIASLGDSDPASTPPRSKAEAREQGDLAGFAPAVAPPDTYIYRGEVIPASVAIRRGLACVQEWSTFRCYDSEADAEAGPP